MHRQGQGAQALGVRCQSQHHCYLHKHGLMAGARKLGDAIHAVLGAAGLQLALVAASDGSPWSESSFLAAEWKATLAVDTSS